MKKVSIIIILILFISSFSGFAVGKNLQNETLIVSPVTPPPTVILTPTPFIKGSPKTLRIPALNIESTIEAKGKDAKGRMDVPTDPKNVSWYSPGVKPGDIGNAVLAGHVNTPQNSPAIFWDLTNLKPGDEIFVDYSSGEIVSFKVMELKDYAVENLPLEQLFAKDNDSNLHLITCSGSWNQQTKNYTNRFVVYAEKVS